MALQADTADLIDQNQRQGQGQESGFWQSVRLFSIDSGLGNVVKDLASRSYMWDRYPSLYIGVMKAPLLLKIVDKIGSKILVGYFLRAIFGALDNPTPPNVIPDTLYLQTDE